MGPALRVAPPVRQRDRGTRSLIIGAVLAACAIPGALAAFLWAAFFSVGFKTSTTESMIEYNLHDPALALFAYGPLLATALLFLAGVALAIRGVVLRARAAP